MAQIPTDHQQHTLLSRATFFKIPNLSCTIFNNIFANIFFYQSVNKAATAVIFEY